MRNKKLMKEVYQEIKGLVHSRKQEKEIDTYYKVIEALQNVQELDQIKIPDVDVNGTHYSLDKETGSILVHPNFKFTSR